MPHTKPMLVDIIVRETLQQLQDSIAKAVNISTIILDDAGIPIANIDNISKFCKLMGDNYNPGGNCRKIQTELCHIARETRQTASMTCPFTGLTGVAVPIFLEDTFLGAWIIGQIRFHGETLPSFRETAHEAGLNSAEARSLLENIPVFSRSEFAAIVDFIATATGEIIKLASGNIEIKKMESELYNLAFFDQNLQIPNGERMEQDIKERRAYETLIAITLTDLRKINNHFGRDCGDALLLAVRDFIIKMSIPNSTLYRGKLSDFCLLFKRTDGDNDIPLKIAEIIHERCQKSWEVLIGEQPQNIFTYANICVLPLSSYHEHFFSHLYGALEHSMDIARKTDSVVIYDDSVREGFQTGLKLELSLKHAVRDNMRGFYVVYQPIVDVVASKWKGVESLCRWDSPEFGPISPGVFIPVAEANGLIGTIGLWVMEQSIMQIKTWGLEQIDKFILEVNLSSLQLANPNLAQKIMDLLKKYDYPPEKLGLEITESSQLNLSGHTMEAIEKLSELGVVIILDDFGTGYSSFNSLHKLPVQMIKTDRTFISGMETDGYLRNLLCIMVSLAHGSDMKFVAEGVESNLQVHYLLKQGADFFQGYFFSHPLTVEQLEDKLDNFSHHLHNLVSIDEMKWDLSGLSESQNIFKEYGLSPAMYKLLNGCLKEIFINPDSISTTDALLEHIGTALNISRSYVFLKDPYDTYSNTNEWCAPGITPKKSTLQHVPLAQMHAQWFDTLKKDGLLVAANIRTLEEEVYETLSKLGAKAVVQFPIWKDTELYGFVGFDNCADTHGWMWEEVQMLHTLTGLITFVLGKTWLQDEVVALNKILEKSLDSLSMIIYVSDLETNKILFANTALQQMHNGDPLKNRTCWEALQSEGERCRFCPIPYLLKNPGESYQWEFYNEVLGKRFLMQDSIIPWMGGKLAHMQSGHPLYEL